MEFVKVLNERHSVRHFDPDKKISDAELSGLFKEVALTPSSFNLQHWKFIVVRDSELRSRLREAAWDQEQITGAAATVVVCGKLDAHYDAAAIYQSAPEQLKSLFLPMIKKFYAGKDQLQRDEALRSASLASMTLMLAAKDRGWDTGPIIGFDPESVSKIIKLTPNYFPVMIIVIGYAKGKSYRRAYRYPVDEFVKIDTLQGVGLR